MTDTVVVEGQVKFRDGKKWKSRWVALRKPSPVADCLLLLAYKDKADKAKGHKERSSVTLEDIYGLEPIVSYEGLPYTLAILCLSQPVMLGFESRDSLLAWDARIRYSLGEVHRFSVGVQPGTKLESGPATLHLCNNLLGIARDLPPVIAGQWKLSDLRRYGAVPNGFVFEGGTRCGYWAGVFFLSCSEGEQISFLFDCIVRGISPTRGPFGLRPSLPDPSADPALAEQRLNLEAQELEKRLSMLSHCSRQSSSASTYSYGTSVTGDDRSISSSSSEASQSDTSIGSRLTMWAEPVMSPAPAESLGPPPGRGALHGEEKLYAAGVGGARVPAKPPRSRRLQEIGRQSSSDSGIATGSHSSYTGSFSSYAGSIDTSQGDEFGSLLSLPPSHAPSDQGPCSCPAPEDPGAEYQAPAALRQLYDTPRSLFQGPPPKDQASLPSSRPPGGGAWGGASTDSIPKWPAPQSQGQASDCPIGQTAPSADLSGICSPQPGIPRPLFEACPVCGGLKGTLPTQSGVLAMPAIPDKKPQRKEDCTSGVVYEITEGCGTEKSAETEDRGRSLEMTGSRGQQKILYEAEGAASASSTSTSKVHRQSSATDPKGSYEPMASTADPPKRFEPCAGEYGGAFVFPPEASHAGGVTDRSRGDGVTYVNIPISPTSKKQLHYMELELQEPGSGVRGNPVQLRRHRGGSTKYAQIDIAATETAHRVGSQHAQGREDRLQELEQKRKGAQQ
ncbi:protein Dok-7 isoform X3 [Conger conger]|uniref:protein Dok-7 isoform X3 n=1 Tax=Conger conger TaxID=82655 RepID=UPI002A5A449E|nr:protein Dok-7 isoform X3 [Conger conger]